MIRRILTICCAIFRLICTHLLMPFCSIFNGDEILSKNQIYGFYGFLQKIGFTFPFVQFWDDCYTIGFEFASPTRSHSPFPVISDKNALSENFYCKILQKFLGIACPIFRKTPLVGVTVTVVESAWEQSNQPRNAMAPKSTSCIHSCEIQIHFRTLILAKSMKFEK